MALTWEKIICFGIIILSSQFVYAKLEQQCDYLTNSVVCVFKDGSDNVYNIPSNNGEIFRLLITNSTINFGKNVFHDVENLTSVEINSTDLLNGMEGAIFRNFTNMFYLTLKNNTNWDVLKQNTFLGLKKLETLIIDSNNIKEIQNGCFCDLPNLEVLRLSHNNFKIVPDSLFNSSEDLTSLFLDNNNIETIEEHSLEGLNKVYLIDLSHNNIHSLNTNVFRNLKQLQYLHLSHNSIQSINSGFQIDNLRFLYLDHNELEVIKSSFFDLENLSLIDLSFNRIKEIEPNAFIKLRNLETFLFRNNSACCSLKMEDIIQKKINIYT